MPFFRKRTTARIWVLLELWRCSLLAAADVYCAAKTSPVFWIDEQFVNLCNRMVLSVVSVAHKKRSLT